MDIDKSKTDKEILEDVYKHTVNNLGIEFGFKPESDFELWYDESEECAFFTHPSVADVQTALGDSRYPVVFVKHNDGVIEIGIVFRTDSSVEENLLGILNSKHKKNKKWLLENFKELNPKFEWTFSINKTKNITIDAGSWVKNCTDLDQHGLSDALYMLNQFREENNKIANDTDSPAVVPTVKFAGTTVESNDYDEAAKIIFEMFNHLNTTVSLPVLKKNWQAKRKKVEEFIGSLEDRVNTSQFAEAIEIRITEQKLELEKLNAAYCMS